MTTKKTTTEDASEDAVTETTTPRQQATATAAPTVVGPPLAIGAEPQTIVLSHHLRIAGSDYEPGARILVSPDYARRLRSQGYTART